MICSVTGKNTEMANFIRLKFLAIPKFFQKMTLIYFSLHYFHIYLITKNMISLIFEVEDFDLHAVVTEIVYLFIYIK